MAQVPEENDKLFELLKSYADSLNKENPALEAYVDVDLYKNSVQQFTFYVKDSKNWHKIKAFQFYCRVARQNEPCELTCYLGTEEVTKEFKTFEDLKEAFKAKINGSEMKKTLRLLINNSEQQERKNQSLVHNS